MKIEIYSKENCPFCEKAKTLCKIKGLEYSEIKNPEEMLVRSPNARTFPQIFVDDVLIGGYTEFESFVNTPTVRTVFNTDNKGYITGDYPLFLGDSLGYKDTIIQPYPVIDQLFQDQMGQIWSETEVDLAQDRQDMITADPSVTGLMVKTILYQHSVDSIASRSISGVLMEMVSNSDLEDLYNAIALFESIHARTYLHIIKQTFVDPAKALREGYSDKEVIKRGTSFREAFDNLLAVPFEASKEEKQKALYPAVVALYILESLNFMASFAVTFGIAETGIYQGISQNVVLICRDEMLHAKAGMEILRIEQKRHPELFRSMKPLLQRMLDDAIDAEDQWTDYLFSEGRQCVGINANLIKQYVRYAAQPVAKTLGLELEEVTKSPLPYMETYIDSSKVQVAAQELQITSYLLNILTPVEDKPNFVKTLKDKYGDF